MSERKFNVILSQSPCKPHGRGMHIPMEFQLSATDYAICGKHASSAKFYSPIAVNESDEADSMTQGFLERMSPN